MALLSLTWVLVAAFSAGCRKPTVAAEVRVADIQYYVEALTAERFAGRLSGTPAGRAATQFVADEHRRNGLAPAFGESYFQEFPFTASEVSVPPGRNRVTITHGGKRVLDSEGVPIPLSKSGNFSGPLVFGGYCIDAGRRRDDFAGLAVKDSVVLCLRFGPGGKEGDLRQEMSFAAKMEAAKRRGARAVVFLGRAKHDPPTAGQFPARARPGPGALYVEPAGFLKAFPRVAAAEAAAERNAELPPDSRGSLDASAQVHTEFEQQRLTGYNVGAFLRPHRPGQRIVIVGAHLDHIGRGEFASVRGAGRTHPGADDNASGTAVLLELAAALKADARLASPVNVLFLHFDGEERGLLGSRAFAESRYFQASQVLAMINLDMVGRLRPEVGLSVQGYDTAERRFQTAIEEAASAAGLGREILRLRRGGRGPSDHTTFYEKKIPVLFLHTGPHRDYHTSDDTADRVNYEGIVRVLRFNEQLVRRLVGLERPLAFRTSSAGSRMGSFRPGLRLGIIPAGYGDADGVEVGSVQEGAPVGRVGLRPGDRVVALGGRRIADIHDLMDFLQTAKADTEYAIEFMRGKEKRAGRTRLMKQ